MRNTDFGSGSTVQQPGLGQSGSGQPGPVEAEPCSARSPRSGAPAWAHQAEPWCVSVFRLSAVCHASPWCTNRGAREAREAWRLRMRLIAGGEAPFGIRRALIRFATGQAARGSKSMPVRSAHHRRRRGAMRPYPPSKRPPRMRCSAGLQRACMDAVLPRLWAGGDPISGIHCGLIGGR